MAIIKVSRGQYQGYETILKSGSVYLADANIDLNGFDLINVDDILSNITNREIRGVAAGYEIRMPSGEDLDIIINTVTEFTFASTTLDLLGNFLSGVGLIQGVTTTNDIDDTTSGWIYGAPTSHRFQIGGVNQLQIANGNISVEDCFIDMTEQTLPAAPAANVGRLFTRDNGAGKTQLVVRFNTGAEQVIATQP